MARALVERNVRAYKHGWITLLSGFFEPIFYLFSLGVGLGALIGEIDAGGGRAVAYASFVAPALMASAAMNGAVFDSTFNVFFKLKYQKLYDSVLSTPLGPRDVAVGEIGWALIRGLLYSTVFLFVAAVSGAVESWWGLLAVPAATLIGFAFAAVGMALTTFMRTWQDFEYVNLAILPMFLFSATFFPLATYPGVLQWVVQATPLYHGVALTRELMLGDIGSGILVHVLYLAVMGLAGVIASAHRVERLLLR
ncbi:ABC transporter permease [Phytoactinopolyspora alkaliphila]|uniref:Transport permease protein n=2 Tax=Phytoactinopolyspora alkaliphila TaxID=1783498 RepID=A0A6N9YFM8_9ACTN|nr:ABC transporter permease [Phytoactinopolyspora alkaliphila]NED93772.1 ABC transporter permease [Phytoactinopolyspora alkaliphila]